MSSGGPSVRTWIVLAVLFTISAIGSIAGIIASVSDKGPFDEPTIEELVEARDYDKIIFYNDEWHLKEDLTDEDWRDAQAWKRSKEIAAYRPDEVAVSGFHVRVGDEEWRIYYFDPFEKVSIYQTDLSEATPRVRFHARGREYRFNCRGDDLAKAFHEAYGIKASMLPLTGDAP